MRAPLLSSALLALAAACAHAPAEAARPAPPVEKVVVTGSRIPQRVDLSTGLPATISPVTIWTQEDLLRAGSPPDDVAGALRKLDPDVR
jgi:outer membrane cobalamin receptor